MSKNICPKGMIKRKGYTAIRDGKKIKVASNCITATSAKGNKRSLEDKAKIRNRNKIHKKMSDKYGHLECPSGQIERAGYTKKGYSRKEYQRKNGTIIKKSNVKATEVRPSCIISRGSKGKKVKIPTVLEKGDLKYFGYSNIKKLSDERRHNILSKANKYMGNSLSLFRKLNILATLNKNQDKVAYEIFKQDANWVKNKYVLKKGTDSSKKNISKKSKSISKKSGSKSSKKSKSITKKSGSKSSKKSKK